MIRKKMKNLKDWEQNIKQTCCICSLQRFQLLIAYAWLNAINLTNTLGLAFENLLLIVIVISD